MKKVLGINCDHADSAACIVIDGKVIAAVEEERFSRSKHHFGFPLNSIKYCLDAAKIKISDLDIVCINSKPSGNFISKIRFVLKNPSSLKLAINRLIYSKKKKYIKLIKSLGFDKEIKLIDHHISHIASSYFVSNFKNSVVLSVDGFGDFSSVAYGIAEKDHIRIDKRVLFPDSIGIFYSAVTQHLGFLNYGDEFKVMGMSSYGFPNYVSALKKIIKFSNNGDIFLNLKYFQHHKKNYFRIHNNTIKMNQIFTSEVDKIIGSKRKNKSEKLTQIHFDIANSLQVVFEEYVLNLVKFLKKKYSNFDNLCLSGGCMNNSLVNGKISNLDLFNNVFISPSPGDSGGALGSALFSIRSCKKDNDFEFSASAGPEYNNHEISNILEEYKQLFLEKKIFVKKIEDDKNLYNFVTELLIKNKIIGWFAGKAEFGPRALGNRSIICNPGMENARGILNEKIKLREKFRPFAGSVLKEHASNWFDCKENEESRFMSKVFKVLEDKKKFIKAIVHQDGTCRIQTVTEEENSRFYHLIKNFFKKKNIPILLNTSFNENEPMVLTPQEAINCFLRTDMDDLVLNNFIVSRVKYD